MKKKLFYLGLIAIALTSCQKDETIVVRNWSSPDGTDFCNGGAATGESGTISYALEDFLSDEEIVSKIKRNNNLSSGTTIFLATTLYGDVHSVAENINPKYLAFPKVIDSMANKWSHAYIEEFNKDNQAFLDKYCNGKPTGAMVYCGY
jgi:hypothetical protein